MPGNPIAFDNDGDYIVMEFMDENDVSKLRSQICDGRPVDISNFIDIVLQCTDKTAFDEQGECHTFKSKMVLCADQEHKSLRLKHIMTTDCPNMLIDDEVNDAKIVFSEGIVISYKVGVGKSFDEPVSRVDFKDGFVVISLESGFTFTFPKQVTVGMYTDDDTIDAKNSIDAIMSSVTEKDVQGMVDELCERLKSHKNKLIDDKGNVSSNGDIYLCNDDVCSFGDYDIRIKSLKKGKK